MRIGLTKTENPEKHHFYVQWLMGKDNVEIIPLSSNENKPANVKRCDALVLSGGIDIHPKFYAGNIEYPGAPEEFKEDRDEFEIETFQMAQQNHIPVLGICRGMQLINIIHQGTLIQHLETEELITLHKGDPDKSHIVEIEENTFLYDIIGKKQTEVNSAHHQGICKLAEGMIINARSDEGLTEGFERQDKTARPFLLAVQWHPERMFRFGLERFPASAALRKRFIIEIKKSIGEKR